MQRKWKVNWESHKIIKHTHGRGEVGRAIQTANPINFTKLVKFIWQTDDRRRKTSKETGDNPLSIRETNQPTNRPANRANELRKVTSKFYFNCKSQQKLHNDHGCVRYKRYIYIQRPGSRRQKPHTRTEKNKKFLSAMTLLEN